MTQKRHPQRGALSLSRETVRELDAGELRAAPGGFHTNVAQCVTPLTAGGCLTALLSPLTFDSCLTPPTN